MNDFIREHQRARANASARRIYYKNKPTIIRQRREKKECPVCHIVLRRDGMYQHRKSKNHQAKLAILTQEELAQAYPPTKPRTRPTEIPHPVVTSLDVNFF